MFKALEMEGGGSQRLVLQLSLSETLDVWRKEKEDHRLVGEDSAKVEIEQEAQKWGMQRPFKCIKQCWAFTLNSICSFEKFCKEKMGICIFKIRFSIQNKNWRVTFSSAGPYGRIFGCFFLGRAQLAKGPPLWRTIESKRIYLQHLHQLRKSWMAFLRWAS